jgi:hypothetical protein
VETLPAGKHLWLSVREITEATSIRLLIKKDGRLDRQVGNVRIFLQLSSSPFEERPRKQQ